MKSIISISVLFLVFMSFWHDVSQPQMLMWHLASNSERDPSNNNISASARCVCSDSWPAGGGGGRGGCYVTSSALIWALLELPPLVWSFLSLPLQSPVGRTIVPLAIIIIGAVICGRDWSSSAAHARSVMSEVVWIKATFSYKQPSPTAV